MRDAIETFDRLSTRLYLEVPSRIRTAADRFTSQEEGQGTAEYVAVIVLIAAVITAVMTLQTDIGEAIKDAIVAAFNNVRDQVAG